MRNSVLSILVLILAIAEVAIARGTYQEPADFVAETFGSATPETGAIWITKDLSESIEEILEHRFATRRVRYWIDGKRSAWILDEIGKERPITTGIVIDDGRIERIKVLVFRESRGWEVRHDFFTDQFRTASLTPDLELDRTIDGVSGATLSVRALKKLARVALFLSQQVSGDATT